MLVLCWGTLNKLGKFKKIAGVYKVANCKKLTFAIYSRWKNKVVSSLC